MLPGKGWSYWRIAVTAGISEATARKDLVQITQKYAPSLPVRTERIGGGFYLARGTSVMVTDLITPLLEMR